MKKLVLTVTIIDITLMAHAQSTNSTVEIKKGLGLLDTNC